MACEMEESRMTPKFWSQDNERIDMLREWRDKKEKVWRRQPQVPDLDLTLECLLRAPSGDGVEFCQDISQGVCAGDTDSLEY